MDKGLAFFGVINGRQNIDLLAADHGQKLIPGRTSDHFHLDTQFFADNLQVIICHTDILSGLINKIKGRPIRLTAHNDLFVVQQPGFLFGRQI